MAAPRPGNHDRGWNDPPMFSYTSKASVQSSPKRTQLNKRIAFPSNPVSKTPNVADGLLNPDCGPPTSPVQLLPPRDLVTTTASTTPTPVPLLIPAMGFTCPPAVTSTPPASSNSDVHSIQEILSRLKLKSDTDLLHHIKSIFDAQFENCLPKLQGRAAEDIRRKLLIFNDSWTEGKISNTVKKKILEIAEAIEEEKYEEAWSYHLLLMIDHTAEVKVPWLFHGTGETYMTIKQDSADIVNQWLVAVKKLIQEAKQAKSESETEMPADEIKGQGQTEMDNDNPVSSDNGGAISLIDVDKVVKKNSDSAKDFGSSVDPNTS